jgi:osmotically-inducible protein OsmY
MFYFNDLRGARMPVKEEILNAVRVAFEREPRINLRRYPVGMDFDEDDNALILEGVIQNVAAKELALELAVAVPNVRGIVDRLKVAPSAPMTDEEIRNHIRDACIQEPTLATCAIRVRTKDKVETFNDPVENLGNIEIIVDDGMVLQEGQDEGTVLLEGQVPSLSHKRLAGVLAWWVPGTQNLLNCLEVVPPEEDNDDEVTDAVRLVLEKDPFVNADQIRVSTQNYVVSLEGLVPNEEAKEMAEFDTWYVFGVDKVINKLEVKNE